MRKKIFPVFVVALVCIPILSATAIGISVNAPDNMNSSKGEMDENPPIEINIVKPRQGFLYIRNMEIMYTGMATILIGPRCGFEVCVEVNRDKADIDHVEFWVDGKIAGIGNWNPLRQYFTWNWQKTFLGSCNLTVVVNLKDKTVGPLNAELTQPMEKIGLWYFNVGRLFSGAF
jgi:hypothetical protein